jgi:diguanylate cyclase (GGDEF)-like protein
MTDAVSPFEESWPDHEAQSVVNAIRSAVTAPAGSGGDAEAIEHSLGEAGRQWALAHQSASLMRTRLAALEASMDAELPAGTEAERSASLRAWRTVTDAATWTSMNQLEQAALVDPLTGVGNRRALDVMLTRTMSGARRSGSELVVVALDLDGLKRINDSLGHAEGDRTLTALVDAVGSGLRASDAVFRTGGDEFAVVLPGTGLGHVDALMERISAGDTPRFTWGAAELTAEQQRPADLLDAADTDLYRHRGVERDLAAVGAGAVVAKLGHSHRSLRSRVSRRVSVAAAAGLVAISGTLATVATLSPGTQTALPPKHGGKSAAPAGGSGGSTSPPTTTPATTSTITPSPSTPSPTAPTPAVATSGGSSVDLATTGSASPNVQLASTVATSPTSIPTPTATPAASPSASPSPTPPAVTTPPTTVPASTATTTRGNSGNSLPAQAVAAQTAAAQAAAARAAARVAERSSDSLLVQAVAQATTAVEAASSDVTQAVQPTVAQSAGNSSGVAPAVPVSAAPAPSSSDSAPPIPTPGSQTGERAPVAPPTPVTGQHPAENPRGGGNSSSRRR